MPDFERWEQPPERCDICGGADDDLLVLDGCNQDGWNPEDPGTPILVCSGCQSWAYRTALLAEYAADDI